MAGGVPTTSFPSYLTHEIPNDTTIKPSITMTGATNADWTGAGTRIYVFTGKFTKAPSVKAKVEFGVNLYRNCNLKDL